MTATNNIIQLDKVCIRYRTRQSFFRHHYFDALNGISFAVKQGETLGLIGRNGCGKSTLLKVLAGIYRPDKGKITFNTSRISLLSLGLGFDLELSGRDNAIISAMLLGASKREAMEKAGAIVDFSELGDFYDQPVKTYSSGMRARLGFSVAVTMHADVLLIDEVLGVGDARFKAKAERVMLDRVNSNQTVVFVSHSLGQVKRLCERTIWLDAGKVRQSGETADIVSQYQQFMQTD